MTIDISREAAQSAIAAGKTAPRFTGYVCCARVYIQVTGKINAKSKKMLDSLGLRVTPRPNHGEAIYIGYDNASGALYSKAAAMAQAFNLAGVSCYEDADMD